jgi:hypothetical protein
MIAVVREEFAFDEEVVVPVLCEGCGHEADETLVCGCCDKVVCTECYLEGGHVDNDQTAQGNEWRMVTGKTTAVVLPVTTERTNLQLGGFYQLRGWRLVQEGDVYYAVHDTYGRTGRRLVEKWQDGVAVHRDIQRLMDVEVALGPWREGGMVRPLLSLLAMQGELQRKLVLLEAEFEFRVSVPRCCGSPYWREIRHGRALVAVHAAGVMCPMHGARPDGERARVYVGAEGGEAANAAVAAMEADKRLTLLEKRYNGLQRRFNHVRQVLDSLLYDCNLLDKELMG